MHAETGLCTVKNCKYGSYIQKKTIQKTKKTKIKYACFFDKFQYFALLLCKKSKTMEILTIRCGYKLNKVFSALTELNKISIS